MYLVVSYRMSMNYPMSTVALVHGVFETEAEANWCVKSWFIGNNTDSENRSQLTGLPGDMGFNARYWRGFTDYTDYDDSILWCASFEIPEELWMTTAEKAEGFEIPIMKKN